MTKNSESGGIGKQDCTPLVNADHSIRGGFDHESMVLLTVAENGFLPFTVGNIGDHAADGVDFTFRVAQRKLLDDSGVESIFVSSHVFEFHQPAGLQHLPIDALKGSSLFR